MATKKPTPVYDNESITALKGADRVRKRPGVMLGSDGLEGCQHTIFEILSNSVDEARAGYGNRILITRYEDYSVEIQDFGRGVPVDYNQKEVSSSETQLSKDRSETWRISLQALIMLHLNRSMHYSMNSLMICQTTISLSLR